MILSNALKVLIAKMYYLNHYPGKYLNLKNRSGGSLGLYICQFWAGELESSIYFAVACLQSAIGRFQEFFLRRIF